MNPAAAAAPAVPSIAGAIGNLIFVLALIVALAWLVKRFRGRAAVGAGGALKVRASVSLGIKEQVVLVDAAGAFLLLGVSPSGITCLHKYDVAPADLPEPEPAFATLLRRVAKDPRHAP